MSKASPVEAPGAGLRKSKRSAPRPFGVYSTPLGRTAIHEAGHVLMAVTEGQPFDDVVLAKTAERHGMVSNVAQRRGDDEVVRVALGGIVAVRLCRAIWYSRLFDNAHDDLGMVADFFRGDEDADWGVAYNVQATVRAISSGWGAIEALANSLIVYRRMTSEAAGRIIAKQRPPREPPTRLTDGDWAPLIENIHRRIKYPRGLLDILQSLESGKLG